MNSIKQIIIIIGAGVVLAYAVINLMPSSSHENNDKPAQIQGRNVLKECGTKYHELKSIVDHKMGWQQFLLQCNAVGAENMNTLLAPKAPDPVPEMLVADEPLDRRIGRTKFDIGDIVCINSHKDVKMTIADITPHCDTCKTYVYYTKWMDKNHHLQRDDHGEKTLTKCD